ncbi:macro domain-containing protein [Robertmurraya yapensis]|uniref:Macro domain-containing protein n=2 Tax=Bacillaceae TaxID=186817 RepID=A0A3S0KMA7_9BACI|nr:macro domain-containing protein [Bacillus yapensis]RTR33970.1 macro domain-containing protein [Bacillus yapensis]TKS97288.1 macro domain-containing protein [Bacillus yapensis]
MPLEIVRNDITKMQVDAIVNAANTQLKMGGGVCGAIFQAAGREKLQKACDAIGHCPVGDAVITEGFKLPAKYIIHTSGPVWNGGTQHEADLLKASYINSLELAKKNECESVAFPLISTGIYGYPKEDALQIAVSTISQFLMSSDMKVYLVVFDKKSFGLSKQLFASINEYIDENYVEELEIHFHRLREEQIVFNEAPSESKYSLVDIMEDLEETFSQRLLRLIDEKNMTDVETYKRANIDRRLFSKIRSDDDYMPKKKTVIAFAIALELDVSETNDLLSTAGYTLSRSSKFDVIIEYFIKERSYNIHQINEALFSFDQPLLGA